MGMINNLKNLAGASDSIIAGRFVANGMLSWRSSSVRDATFKFSLDHRRGYNEEHQALIAEDFYPMNTPDKSMKDTEETKKATTTTRKDNSKKTNTKEKHVESPTINWIPEESPETPKTEKQSRKRSFPTDSDRETPSPKRRKTSETNTPEDNDARKSSSPVFNKIVAPPPDLEDEKLRRKYQQRHRGGFQKGKKKRPL